MDARQARMAELLRECYGRYVRASGRVTRDADWLSDADYLLAQLDATPYSESESTALCRVQCPDCGVFVPVGVLPGEIDESGNLVIEPDLSDVWAHSFQHRDEAAS